jgi:hypothetical protein
MQLVVQVADETWFIIELKNAQISIGRITKRPGVSRIHFDAPTHRRPPDTSNLSCKTLEKLGT